LTASSRWVVDASPLIVLGKVGELHLLMELVDTLVVPLAVAREIERGPAGDPAVEWLLGEGRSSIRDTGGVAPIIAGWDLGTGESHALSWAAGNPGFEAVVDDRAARKCARVLGVPVRGTLGVLLLARREGRIERMAPLMEHIRQAGLFIDPETLLAVLRLADENPR